MTKETPEPYVHQEFPKWVNGRIVASAAEEQLVLGNDDLKTEDGSQKPEAPAAPVAKKAKAEKS